MRSFWVLLCVSVVSRAQQPVTARQMIDRIQAHLGVSMPADTVDTFKAGDPDTPVHGVAVTMMATYNVLERAAASGKNLIITHEPTFYNHQDATDELGKGKDPVLAAKQKFIADHHLVVWRFHDGWHARRPDGILLGMVEALGWQKYQSAREPDLFVLPEVSLKDLAAQVTRKLNIKAMRVVGNPNMTLTKVAFLPGAAGSSRQIQALQNIDVEALLIGEAREWETVEYAADAVSEGKRKALVILGHIPSEQAGMEECASWLRTFNPGVSIEFVPAEEPFWLP